MARYLVNKNLGMPKEMVMDGKESLKDSYLSQSDCRICDMLVGFY